MSLEKEWRQPQIDFIVAHLQVDMTAGELASLYRTTSQDVWRAVIASGRIPGAQFHRGMPTAFCSPYPAKIGVDIRKASWEDEYKPISLKEFHAIHPDGLRP